MFNKSRARSGPKWAAVVVAFASMGSSSLNAAVVGQWNQNPNDTNWATSSNFSSFYLSAFVTGGHTINPAGTTGEVTLSNLNNFTHFVLNTSANAAATNFSDLSTWVNGGGIAILFLGGSNDSSANALANTILASMGSSISATNSTVGVGGFSTVGSLTGSDVAVNGLTGSSLTMIQANTLTGGSLLALDGVPNPMSNLGAALRVDNIGLGKVYVFGEHFENKFYIMQGNNSNLQLFLNLLNQGSLQGGGGGPPGPGSDQPEPATLLLTGVALAGLAYWKYKR